MASTEDRQPTVLRYRGTRVPGTTVRCTRSTVQVMVLSAHIVFT